MDLNIATQRKEAGGKKLRADSFEKVHHENCPPLLFFLKNYQMNRETNYHTKWSQIYQIVA